MSVHYQDDHLTLHHGDALIVLSDIPSDSVNCIVTSPPYFGLRNYGEKDQLGSEKTPEEYVEALTKVFKKAHRVLSPDGTLWLNLGDTYANNGRTASKNLLGIPWRVALSLQDTGWILRNDIIWEKPNAMPEPVKDRLTNRHEHLFLFSKSPTYWFDLDPIREPHTTQSDVIHWTKRKHEQSFLPENKQQANGVKGRVSGVAGYSEGGKNPGDIWKINTKPFAEAHFATMPPELAARCVLTGSHPGGTVLDPFSGAGTSGMAAIQNGRRYIGIDVSKKYLDLSLRTRLSQGAFNLYDASTKEPQ